MSPVKTCLQLAFVTLHVCAFIKHVQLQSGARAATAISYEAFDWSTGAADHVTLHCVFAQEPKKDMLEVNIALFSLKLQSVILCSKTRNY